MNWEAVALWPFSSFLAAGAEAGAEAMVGENLEALGVGVGAGVGIDAIGAVGVGAGAIGTGVDVGAAGAGAGEAVARMEAAPEAVEAGIATAMFAAEISRRCFLA
jgi:hypothetical protein